MILLWADALTGTEQVVLGPMLASVSRSVCSLQ